MISAVKIRALGFLLFAVAAHGQRPKFDAFEVAAVKRTPPEWTRGRFIRMESGNRLVVRNNTLKRMLGAAYNLPNGLISGGPAWIDTDSYDVVAVTPGEVRPSQGEQMKMLRQLLKERFQIEFHWEKKTMAAYLLSVDKDGVKFKSSEGDKEDQPALLNSIFPDHVEMPAKNASIGDFASLLQRSVLERPVVDRTGMAGRYDFKLEWAADGSQFGGMLPAAAEPPKHPDLYAAVRQQLGLRLEAGRAAVDTMAVERAERPSEN